MMLVFLGSLSFFARSPWEKVESQSIEVICGPSDIMTGYKLGRDNNSDEDFNRKKSHEKSREC